MKANDNKEHPSEIKEDSPEPLSGKAPRKKTALRITALLLILTGVLCAAVLLPEKPRTKPGDRPKLSLEESIAQLMPLYEADIIDSMTTMKSNADVASYLLSWAKNKGISAFPLENDAVLFHLPTSDGIAQSLTGTTVVCPYDIEGMSKSIDSIVSSLTVARSAKTHGDLRFIFLPFSLSQEQKAGILSEENIRFNNRVLVFEDSLSSRLATVTGGYEKTRVYRHLQLTEPIFTKAYTLSFSGFPCTPVGERSLSQPNPIMMVGSMLASLKSTAHLFELSDFQGGTSSDNTVGEASVTISVSDEEEEYLLETLESFVEKFNDEYSGDYPQVSLEYAQAEALPAQVFSGGDLDSIISFMYTASNGIYERSGNGDILGVSNIGRLYTEEATFNIEISSYSSSEVTMNALRESYVTIAGLVGLSYEQLVSLPHFDGKDASAELRNQLKSACDTYGAKTDFNYYDYFDYTLCNIISQTVPSAPLLYVGVTEDNMEALIGGLVTMTHVGTVETNGQP